ncbi:MAG: DnaD domain protein, partial [Ruminococcus sp.]|nr:DnaD domain protein [Ruminococcus sp.]
MSIQINLGAWRSVFAVPSQIVDEGLKFADGVKLKVLLYVLRNADRELALEEISKATGVNVTDIPEALDYWVSREVLQKNTAGYAPKANDHQTEQEKPVVKETKTVASISKDVEQQRQRFVVTKPQKPDYVFTAQRLAADEDLKILVSEAQTMLGKTLSNSDVATLLMLKDTCGLRLDVILMLIQYCVGIDKGNMRTVEKIGISWADEGI